MKFAEYPKPNHSLSGRVITYKLGIAMNLNACGIGQGNIQNK